MKSPVFYIVIIAFLLSSCNNDVNIKESAKDFTVKIGLQREPRALCPIKRNGNIERQVNQYIFLQAADFDPFTLKNTPVLL
jgi:hypothetical protein